MTTDAAKRVTLAQVAELAGVSVMTASYTYNRPGRVSDEARSKVLAAADRLGYAGPDPSARSLRRGSTSTLGVVMGEHLSYAFEDPQAASFLAGIADVCADRGYGMTILPITGAASDVVRVRAAAVDGFIVWTTADDDPVLAAVRSTKRPSVVHCGPAVPGLGLVGIDDRAAARAVGAAAFAGSVRPAVLSFPFTRERASFSVRGADLADVSFPVTRDRLEGFRQAALDSGLSWDDVLVAVCARNDAAEAADRTKEMEAQFVYNQKLNQDNEDIKKQWADETDLLKGKIKKLTNEIASLTDKSDIARRRCGRENRRRARAGADLGCSRGRTFGTTRSARSPASICPIARCISISDRPTA